MIIIPIRSASRKTTPKQKFDNARALNGQLPKIIENYELDLKSEDRKQQQRGVLIYLLCETGYRPGSNKTPRKKDGELTGTGLCTLRKSHIQSFDGETSTVRLKCRGKRHTEFDERLQFPDRVYELFQKFYDECQNDDDRLFNKMSYDNLHSYLKNSYKLKHSHLTSRVFRTHKASVEFQNELKQRTAIWRLKNPNPNTKDLLRALKKILKVTKEKVMKILKHKSTGTLMSYVDPRIVLAWLVIVDLC